MEDSLFLCIANQNSEYGLLERFDDTQSSLIWIF